MKRTQLAVDTCCVVTTLQTPATTTWLRVRVVCWVDGEAGIIDAAVSVVVAVTGCIKYQRYDWRHEIRVRSECFDSGNDLYVLVNTLKDEQV